MNSHNKHIAFVKQTFKLQGGLEKYCFELSRFFSKRGYTVSILTSSYDKVKGESFSKSFFTTHGMHEGVRLIIFSLPLSFLKLSFIQLLLFDAYTRVWKRKNPDVLLFGFDRHFIPLSFYRAGNGCHRAYLERRKGEASWLKKITLKLNPLHWCTLLSEKKTYESPVTQVVCNSNLVRSEILKYYPKADPKRIHVIHNGVDWMRVQPLFEEAIHLPQKSKRDWGISEDALHIVMVGHEWFRKGADILLEAIPFVVKAIPQVPLYITIAGKERNPAQFQKRVEKLGIAHFVQFIPKQVASNHLFQSANIAVVPSRYDPFANVTLEALAMGLWTVTSSENGGSEVIDDSIGYVAKELKAEEIAQGIIIGIQKLLSLEVTKVSIREKARMYDFSYKLDEYIQLLETHS